MTTGTHDCDGACEVAGVGIGVGAGEVRCEGGDGEPGSEQSFQPGLVFASSEDHTMMPVYVPSGGALVPL